MSFWQGREPWGNEIIHVGGGDGEPRMRKAGCVITTAALLLNRLRGSAMDPLQMLRLFQRTPGILVAADGVTPGDLVVWPAACKALLLQCDDAIAAAADHENNWHEFSGHLVDPNADLAGELAKALEGGGTAAVRVDINGDGKGDHTIACYGRVGDAFLCDCPALARTITLDPNLEQNDVYWGAAHRPYRAVGIRAVYLP